MIYACFEGFNYTKAIVVRLKIFTKLNTIFKGFQNLKLQRNKF